MAKVLIVEDDVELAETYQDILEITGHEVDVISTSHQAVAYLVAGRHRPDIVILDMNLHGDSGVVVLGLIRRIPRLAKTKVIIASGFPDLAKRAISEWGADLFLPKPVSMDALTGSIGGFMAQPG